MGREDDVENDDSVGKTNGGKTTGQPIFGIVYDSGGHPRDGPGDAETYGGASKSGQRLQGDAQDRKRNRGVDDDERERRLLAEKAERKRKRIGIFDTSKGR